eukprot:TRINITY_DN4537_c0_g1_i2.p1 TRINITY_DN4537_c0_g1~~TRINITY_DN4537_c0_g1_i2.p1  ORF type:complete len:213 (+),score=44.64 TRINITY_DN4537_c0_g1_i2:2-640(+)
MDSTQNELSAEQEEIPQGMVYHSIPTTKVPPSHEIDPNKEYIDWTNRRCRELPDLSHLVSLKSLTLRTNLLSHLDALGSDNLNTLTELNLYGNSIEEIDHLNHLSSLTKLDLSFNFIKPIQGVDQLTNLTSLYFANNKINKIEGLENLTNLKYLELGANGIRKIEGLDTLVNLEELWLGKNKITRLENLDSLTNLKILSMQVFFFFVLILKE